SLLTGACSYLIAEYFLGLEFLRLAIIGILLSGESNGRGLRRVGPPLIAWSPYAAVWTAYVLWRAFAFRVASDYGGPSSKDVGAGVSHILSRPIHEVAARVF